MQGGSYIGLTGYYRKFIPDYAKIAAPLTDLTRKDNKKLKSILCSSLVLASPDFTRPFTLQTDASDRGMRTVLSQCDDDGQEHPITYFSRKLLPRKEHYSTIKKECSAIKLGVQTFKVHLLGRQFAVQTDHRALEWLERLKDNNHRLTCWSLTLQPYDFSAKYQAN